MGQETIKIFTDTLTSVLLLQAKLTGLGIASRVKNNFDSGVIAGFGGGLSNSVELYILEEDFKKAEKLIEEFKENLQ